MSFRPTITLWYIVAAPFVTLAFLLCGRAEGLWILFFSHLALTLTTIVPSWQGFGPVFTRFCTTQREVWLTIDDGPDPETTPQILKLLDQFRAKATFFLIGEQTAQWPALAAQILEAGHSIGNHTHSHPVFQFWRLTPKQIRREIADFERVARFHGLPVPALFRAPTGMKNPFVHPILAARGLRIVGWSARAFDTRGKSSDEIVSRIAKAATTGSIILLHEGSPVAVAALSKLLDNLASSGLQCVIPNFQALRANAVDRNEGWGKLKGVDSYYSELAAVLRDRFFVIADHEARDRNPKEHLQRLQILSEKLEHLKKSLPENADPMLAHYLERMSLSKALAFIETNCLRS